MAGIPTVTFVLRAAVLWCGLWAAAAAPMGVVAAPGCVISAAGGGLKVVPAATCAQTAAEDVHVELAAKAVADAPHLDLKGLDIRGVEAGSFDGLQITGNLDLSMNALGDLPAGMFSGLVGGVIGGNLVLSNSGVGRIVPGAMPNVDGYLHLQGGNTVGVLETGAFSGLTIGVFHANNAGITGFQAGAFENMRCNGQMHLYQNVVPTLVTGAFKNLYVEHDLFLNGVSVSTVQESAFVGANVGALWLGGNTLGQLPRGFLDGLTVRSNLGIANSGITAVAPGWIAATVAGDLLMNGNPLNGPLGAGALASITVGGDLDLSSCGLTEIQAGAFSGTSVGAQLLLAGNKLGWAAEGEIASVGAASADVFGGTSTNAWQFGNATCIERTVLGQTICESVTVAPSSRIPTYVSWANLAHVLVGLDVTSSGTASSSLTTNYVVTPLTDTGLPTSQGSVPGAAKVFVDGSPTFAAVSRTAANAQQIRVRLTPEVGGAGGDFGDAVATIPAYEEFVLELSTDGHPGCVLNVAAGGRRIGAEADCDPALGADVEVQFEPIIHDVTADIQLQGMDIRSIAPYSFNGTRYSSSLLLAGNTIPELPSFSLSGMVVSTVDIRGSAVERIAANAFAGTLCKGSILLTGNNFGNGLAPGAFRGLDVERYDLQLHESSISSIAAGVFDGAHVGGGLLLGGNSLGRLPAGALRGLELDGNLNLQTAGITSIEGGAMPVSIGGDVMMFGNDIGVIEELAFGGMYVAGSFRLGNAGVTGMSARAWQGTYIVGDLLIEPPPGGNVNPPRPNSLGVIASYAFQDLRVGWRLSLAQCGITGIQSDAFKDVRVGGTLDFSLNTLGHLPTRAFADMEVGVHLQLMAVGITDLDPLVFQGTEVVQVLNLANNLLRSLRTGSLAEVEVGQWLILDSQPTLATIEVGAFRGTTYAGGLSLIGASLKSVPEGELLPPGTSRFVATGVPWAFGESYCFIRTSDDGVQFCESVMIEPLFGMQYSSWAAARHMFFRLNVTTTGPSSDAFQTVAYTVMLLPEATNHHADATGPGSIQDGFFVDGGPALAGTSRLAADGAVLRVQLQPVATGIPGNRSTLPVVLEYNVTLRTAADPGPGCLVRHRSNNSLYLVNESSCTPAAIDSAHATLVTQLEPQYDSDLDLADMRIQGVEPFALNGLVVNGNQFVLRSNYLGVLERGAFYGLRCQELYLDSAGITGVRPGAFQAAHVVHLNMEKNQLGELLPDTFVGVTIERALRIHTSGITRIHPGAFHGLKLDWSLELDSNNLGELEEGAFAGIQIGQDVLLTKCSITGIQPGAFAGAMVDRDIRFGLNTIGQLQPGALAGIQGAGTLSLEGAGVTDILPGSLNNSQFAALNVGSNPLLHRLRPHAFANLTVRYDISFASAGLSVIEPEAFGGGFSVSEPRVVRISGNSLVSVPEGELEFAMRATDLFDAGSNPWGFEQPFCVKRTVLGSEFCEAVIVQAGPAPAVVAWQRISEIKVAIAAVTTGPVSALGNIGVNYEVSVVRPTDGASLQLPVSSGYAGNASVWLTVNASESFAAVDSESVDGALLRIRLTPRLRGAGDTNATASVPASVEVNVTLDGLLPVVSFVSAPVQYSRSTDADFLLGCTEVACRYTYSVDGGLPRAVRTAGSGDDEAVTADVDAAVIIGVAIDNISGAANVSLPTAPPAVLSGGADPLVIPIAAVRVTDDVRMSAVSTGVRVQLRVDDRDVETLTASEAAVWAAPAGLADGSHVLTAVASGVSGENSPATATTSVLTWRIDSTAPVAELVATKQGPKRYASDLYDATSAVEQEVATVVSCDETCDHLQWQLSNESAAWINMPPTNRVVQHSVAVRIRGVDFAGNVGAALEAAAAGSPPSPPGVQVVVAPPSRLVAGGAEAAHGGRVEWIADAPLAEIAGGLVYEVLSSTTPSSSCGDAMAEWQRVLRSWWEAPVPSSNGVACDMRLRIRAVNGNGQTGPETEVAWQTIRPVPLVQVLAAPDEATLVRANPIDGGGRVVFDANIGTVVEASYSASPLDACGAPPLLAEWHHIDHGAFIAPMPATVGVNCDARLSLRAVDPVTLTTSEPIELSWQVATTTVPAPPVLLQVPVDESIRSFGELSQEHVTRVSWGSPCAPGLPRCSSEYRLLTWPIGSVAPALEPEAQWKSAAGMSELLIPAPRSGGHFWVQLRTVWDGTIRSDVSSSQWAVLAPHVSIATVQVDVVASEPPVEANADQLSFVLPWEDSPWALLAPKGGAVAVQYRVRNVTDGAEQGAWGAWQAALPTVPVVAARWRDKYEIDARGVDAGGWPSDTTASFAWHAAQLAVELPPGAAPDAGSVSPLATAVFRPEITPAVDDAHAAARLEAAGLRLQFRFGHAPAPQAGDENVAQPWLWASASADSPIAIGPLPDGQYWCHLRAVVGDGRGERTSVVAVREWGVDASGAAVVSLFGVQEGDHHISVNAKDVVGNVGPAAVYTWAVDRSPPVINLVPQGSFVHHNSDANDDGELAGDVVLLTSNASVTWIVTAKDASTSSQEPQLCDGARCSVHWRVAPPTTSLDQSSWQPVALGEAITDNLGRAALVVPSSVDGEYALEVEVEDAALNAPSLTTIAVWHVDSTAPSQLLATLSTGVGSIGGDSVNSKAAEFEVDVSAVDSGIGASTADGARMCLGCIATVRTAAGSWAARFQQSGSVARVTVGPFVDGLVELGISVTDAAGLTTPAPAPLSVLVDTIPPSCDFLAAAPASVLGGGLVNVSDVVITVSADSGGGTPVAQLLLAVDGVAAGDVSGIAAQGLVDLSVRSLAEGRHTAALSAMDSAGNLHESCAMESFSVDLTPPVSKWVHAPAPVESRSQIPIEVSVVDANVQESWLAIVAQLGPQRLLSDADLAAATWLPTASLSPAGILAAPAEGYWVALVRARDAAGNFELAASTLASAVWFRTDRTAPAIHLVAATLPRPIGNDPMVAVDFSVVDEGTLVSIDVELAAADAVDAATSVNAAEPVPQEALIGVDLTLSNSSQQHNRVSAISQLPDGAWALRVRAADDAALRSSWSTVRFNVDTTAPTATLQPTSSVAAVDVPDITNSGVGAEAQVAAAAAAAAAGKASVGSVVSPSSDVSFDIRCDDEASPCNLQARLVVLASATDVAGCGQRRLSHLGRHRTLQQGTQTDSDSGVISDAQEQLSDWTTVLEASTPGTDALGEPLPVSMHSSAGRVIANLIDGGYRLLLRSVDGAGNIGEAVAWHSDVYVDTVAPAAPTIESAIESGGQTRLASAVFDISLHDDASPGQPQMQFEWRLTVAGDAQSEDYIPLALDAALTELAGSVPTARLTVGAATGQPGALPDGDHALLVRARDAAGNGGTVVEFRWSVLAAAPTIEVQRKPAELVGLDVVSIEVRASAPDGSAPDVAQFEASLNGGAWRAVCEHGYADGNGVSATVEADRRCEFEQLAADLQIHVLQVRVVNAVGTASVPASLSWTRSQCTGAEYAEVNATTGALRCKSCPLGADCQDPLVLRTFVNAKPGFWKPQDGFEFYECPLSSCLGERPGGPNGTMLPSGCAEGYTGRLCSLCAENYFMQFRKCSKCPESQGASIGAIAGISTVLVIAGVVLFRLRQQLPMDVAKVVVSFLQVVGSANVAFRINWPPAFEDNLDAFKVAMLDFLTLTRVSCAAPMTFYSSFGATLAIFLGLSAIGVMAMVVVDGVHRKRERGAIMIELAARAPATATAASRSTGGGPIPGRQRGTRRNQRRRSSIAFVAQQMGDVELYSALSRLRWARVFSALSQFWLLCYPGVSVKMMRVFKCVQVQGSYWLEADMRLECFTSQWAVTAIIAAVMLIIYTCGLPLGVTLWLRSRRTTLDDPKTRKELGFLYQIYGTASGQYLWEVVELVRKLVLTSFVLFFSSGSPLQITFALMVSAYAHVAHSLYRPFISRRVYLLQHASLAVTTFVFSIGLLFKVGAVGSAAASDTGIGGNDQTLNSLGVLLVLACSGFLVVAAFVAGAQLHANIRHSKRYAVLVRKLRAAASRSSLIRPPRQSRGERIARASAQKDGGRGANVASSVNRKEDQTDFVFRNPMQSRERRAPQSP